MEYAKFMSSPDVRRPLVHQVHNEIRDMLDEMVEYDVRKKEYIFMDVEKMSIMSKAIKKLYKDAKIAYDIESMEFKINMEGCNLEDVLWMHHQYDGNHIF
jgi:hypothetical protein